MLAFTRFEGAGGGAGAGFVYARQVLGGSNQLGLILPRLLAVAIVVPPPTPRLLKLCEKTRRRSADLSIHLRPFVDAI